jgi:protein-tyrosine phosphatase
VSSSDRQRPTPFSILVVCTGNICRSPIAEQLLRARFAASGLDVTVSSAGTGALVGASMTPEAAQLSMNYGGVPSSHRARELTETLVANADLVLTATRDHRQAVATLHPRASRHTYTLAQSDAGATALADSGPLHRRLTALVDQVAESRGFAPPPAHAEAEDIPDPYRQSQEVYDRVGALLDSSVETIAAFLATATAER